MDLLTRRHGIGAILSSFAVYALVGEAGAASKPGSVACWIDEQQTLASDLAAGRIKGAAWSAGVERLASKVDLEELGREITNARVTQGRRGSHSDPVKRHVRFIDETGQPRELAFGVALFDFAPDNVITPHGHRHMVSAHMVVNGAFRVRNFDRVGDEPGAMLLRPTRDYVARVGAVSIMCSERDNIHWFVPQGGPATTFDLVISGLDQDAPDYDIEAVDPVRGERLAGGLVRAPIIGFDESSRFYTASI